MEPKAQPWDSPTPPNPFSGGLSPHFLVAYLDHLPTISTHTLGARGIGYLFSHWVSLHGVATRSGKRIAIEVETGRSNAVENVRKALDAGFDRAISASVTPEAKRRTLTSLPKAEIAPNPRVRVIYARESF